MAGDISAVQEFISNVMFDIENVINIKCDGFNESVGLINNVFHAQSLSFTMKKQQQKQKPTTKVKHKRN